MYHIDNEGESAQIRVKNVLKFLGKVEKIDGERNEKKERRNVRN